MNVRLYLWQRGTAALLAPMVAVHLLVMFYAARQGFSAADILGRTEGSVAWALFYGAFVTAAAIHAAIGVRGILIEWGKLADAWASRLAAALGVILLVLGWRAVYAVVFA